MTDDRKIRASQGHSVQVDLALEPTTPPRVLYHGTALRNAGSIAQLGLQPRGRHHVHLSPDTDTARAVGARHGEPVIYTVDATGMSNAGHVFFRSANGVWLTDHVPQQFLSDGS